MCGSYGILALDKLATSKIDFFFFFFLVCGGNGYLGPDLPRCRGHRHTPWGWSS